MGRKTGLGDNPLSWIVDTSKEAGIKKKPRERLKEVKKFKTSEVPKFQTFEVKLSILLRQDQLEFLEKLTREIMTNRGSINKRERITKNTILRACIDALKDLDINKENIPDEAELLRRIKNRIKPNQI